MRWTALSLTLPLFVFALFSAAPKRVLLSQPSGNYFAFSALGPPFFSIQGYEINCRLELFRTDAEEKGYAFPLKGQTYRLQFNREHSRLTISRNALPQIEISLGQVVAAIQDYRSRSPSTSPFAVPQKVMTLEVKNSQMEVKILFYNLSGRELGGKTTMDHLKSDVLLKPI